MAIDERQLFEAVELDMSPAFRRRLESELNAAARVEVDFETVDHDLDQVAVIATTPTGPPHRWKPLALVGTAALVFVGLAFVVRNNDGNQEPFRPGVDTVVPQPDASQVPSTSTSESTTSTTTTPATTIAAPVVAPIYTDPTTQQLATIQSSAETLLAGFDTMRAVATWRSSTQGPDGQVSDDQEVVNTVTLSSNGSMWSLTPNGWSSYDSSTATALTQAVGSDGVPIYTRFDNFTSLPLPVILGLDPTPHLDALGADVEVGESEQDGRPVWEVTSVRDTTGPDGTTTHTEETLDIDKATGLVIGRAATSTSGDTVRVQTATLSNLELNVDFPPAGYPGSFPTGAEVQGSPGPSSFHLLTIDEADPRFGGGLVAPSPLPPTARIFVDVVPNVTPILVGVGSVPLRIPTAITFDFPQGFAPSSITIFKDADVGAPTSTIGAGGASVVTQGQFEGAPSELHLGVLTIDDGSVTIIIRASSDIRALEIANSLVRVG